jgi:hypothetical protein
VEIMGIIKVIDDTVGAIITLVEGVTGQGRPENKLKIGEDQEKAEREAEDRELRAEREERWRNNSR